jgi:hypothetical protein
MKPFRIIAGVAVAAIIAIVSEIALSAVTIREIVAMSKAGVTEQVILAVIDRDKNVFTLGVDDLAMLKKEGVTDNIVIAMLRSGREEPPSWVAQPAVAAAPVAPVSDDGPTVVLVGHDPDRPNTSASDPQPMFGGPYFLPYFAPVVASRPGAHWRARAAHCDAAVISPAPPVVRAAPVQPMFSAPVQPLYVAPQAGTRPCASLHLTR